MPNRGLAVETVGGGSEDTCVGDVYFEIQTTSIEAVPV